MSTVNVDTDAGLIGYGAIAGGTVLVAGALYLAGFSFSNFSNILLAVTAVLVALLMWLLLTDHVKLSVFIQKNQLLALVCASVVSTSVLLSIVQNLGIKSLMPH